VGGSGPIGNRFCCLPDKLTIKWPISQQNILLKVVKMQANFERLC
jgi:hypothetical protein